MHDKCHEIMYMMYIPYTTWDDWESMIYAMRLYIWCIFHIPYEMSKLICEGHSTYLMLRVWELYECDWFHSHRVQVTTSLLWCIINAQRQWKCTLPAQGDGGYAITKNEFNINVMIIIIICMVCCILMLFEHCSWFIFYDGMRMCLVKKIDH